MIMRCFFCNLFCQPSSFLKRPLSNPKFGRRGIRFGFKRIVWTLKALWMLKECKNAFTYKIFLQSIDFNEFIKLKRP